MDGDTAMVMTIERHVSGRRIRRDALPEHVDFQDHGCELAPSCLRCPLVRCRYDEPGGARKIRQDPRDEALRMRHAEGAAIDALASEFGISRRSVFRVLARGREREAETDSRGKAGRHTVIEVLGTK